MKILCFFSIKYRYSDILLKKHKLHLSRFFCCNHTCCCVNMVSLMTSASRYKTSASHITRIIKADSRIHPWSDSTEFRGIGRGSSDWLRRRRKKKEAKVEQGKEKLYLAIVQVLSLLSRISGPNTVNITPHFVFIPNFNSE